MEPNLNKTIRMDDTMKDKAMSKVKKTIKEQTVTMGKKVEERRMSASNIMTVDITEEEVGQERKMWADVLMRLGRSYSLSIGSEKRKAEGRPSLDVGERVTGRNEEGPYRREECTEAQTLLYAIEDNAGLIKQMQALVEACKDKRVEAAFDRLRRNCEILERGMIKTWFEGSRYVEVEELGIEGCTQTEQDTKEQEHKRLRGRGAERQGAHPGGSG